MSLNTWRRNRTMSDDTSTDYSNYSHVSQVQRSNSVVSVSEDFSEASKRRKGLYSSVSSMFSKWTQKSEIVEPSSSMGPELRQPKFGRSLTRGGSQTRANTSQDPIRLTYGSEQKKKRPSLTDKEKLKRREAERRKREEEDKRLDALAFKHLLGGNEDVDHLYNFQKSVQSHRSNVEAGIDFANIRSELLQDVHDLEHHYSTELQKIITKQRERLKKRLSEINQDQYESFVKWGIRDTLGYVDILKIKVREHAAMANECRSCQQQLQALINSPVYSYAQQEKWDYQDMCDQIHNLEILKDRLNRKLQRLVKVIGDTNGTSQKNVIHFGNYTCVPLSESQICRLTSPQSRKNLMDLMRNYVRKLDKVSELRNSYYDGLLRKIQNRLDESSQACDTNIHDHRRRFAKLKKYCSKTIHHKEQEYEQSDLSEYVSIEDLKNPDNPFFPIQMTDVLIPPSQLSNILKRLPADFMERLRSADHNNLPKPTLGDIVGNEELRLTFWKFLQDNRCDENIGFILAVDNLMDEEDESLINQQINDIYTAYIMKNAEQEVNLSHAMREKVIQKRKEKTSIAEFQTCYEIAYKEIATLLSKEQVSNFIDSPNYKGFISKYGHRQFE